VRLVIFGVIGLAIGMGGGIGYSFTLGAPAEVPADGAEVTTDSAQVAVEDSAEVREPAPVDSSASEAPILASDSAETAAQPETRSQRIASSLIRSSARDSSRDETPSEADPPSSVPDSASESPGEAEPEVQDEPAEDPVARAVAQAADMDPAALSTESEAGYRKVSRILAAMDADRAAQVLESLRDGEVRQLIGFFPPEPRRQSSQSSIPPAWPD